MDFSSISVPLVKGLSHVQIEKEALGFLSATSPQILHLPQATPILDIFENKMELFNFRILIGKNVKGLGGFTDVTHHYIQLSNSTYRRLEKGDPQAKFTVAHEFGHVRLHASYKSAVFARRSQIRPFEDPEWQANAFAAAVLMPLPTMRFLFHRNRMIPEEVMEHYQVSWSAATRRVLHLQKTFEKWRPG